MPFYVLCLFSIFLPSTMVVGVHGVSRCSTCRHGPDPHLFSFSKMVIPFVFHLHGISLGYMENWVYRNLFFCSLRICFHLCKVPKEGDINDCTDPSIVRNYFCCRSMHIIEITSKVVYFHSRQLKLI